jgi:hypothetical protein
MAFAGESFQTMMKKNTAVVMEARLYNDNWFLYCKKNKTIKFEINECIRVGRWLAGFVKLTISPTCNLKIINDCAPEQSAVL